MSRSLDSAGFGALIRTVAASLLVVLSACSNDAAGPTTQSEAPAGTPPTDAPPADAPTADAPEPATPQGGSILDNRSNQPGIVFGTFNMDNQYLNNVHTGWMNGGPLDPSSILAWLSGARAKGGRVVLKLCKGRDSFIKNSNGTFSLTKWKDLVGRYRNIPLGPYIADGTILGHFLIDEPHRASRWGGKAISHVTLEEMAKFSKQLWPEMTTMIRVAPSWLASTSLTYQYVDAGWTQYTKDKGNAATWVAAEAAAARRKGLGLVVGMNVLDGGNGSSGIRSPTRAGMWSMSASEIRSYGNAMLAESLACGFFSWQHNTSYYNRSDIKSAMADVSAKARAHGKTACRQ
jgi:hypothetical protein